MNQREDGFSTTIDRWRRKVPTNTFISTLTNKISFLMLSMFLGNERKTKFRSFVHLKLFSSLILKSIPSRLTGPFIILTCSVRPVISSSIHLYQKPVALIFFAIPVLKSPFNLQTAMLRFQAILISNRN